MHLLSLYAETICSRVGNSEDTVYPSVLSIMSTTCRHLMSTTNTFLLSYYQPPPCSYFVLPPYVFGIIKSHR